MSEPYICIVITVDKKYCGYVLGGFPSLPEVLDYKIEFIEEKPIYLYSLVVDKKYRDKGYGKELLIKFIEEAKRQKYTTLYGHYCKNSSLKTIMSFGAEIIDKEDNWEGTKETFIFCKLKLNKDI